MINPSTQPNYQIIAGQYVLFKGDTPVQPGLDEVALAYAYCAENSNYQWHKHGSPKMVNEWTEYTKAALSKAGPLGQKMSSEFNVLQGRLDLDLLNSAIAGSSRSLQELSQRQQAIEVPAVRITSDTSDTSEPEPQVFAPVARRTGPR